MAYEAKVLCHTSGPDGQELATFLVRYPRKVLAEVQTHRTAYDELGEEIVAYARTTTPDVSKNSASSRAIPVERMLAAVLEDPYVPERFSRNGAGMQGHGWLERAEHEAAVADWLAARDSAVWHARVMLGHGVHKQEVNRLLEPWAWITQVLTVDKFGLANFFALRCDAMADPAFSRVARMMYLRYRKSTPTPLDYGEWHLPFVPPAESAGFRFAPRWLERADEFPDPIVASAARCAWVSFENHEKDGTIEQMRKTFNRLIAANPKHASPIEHQGTPHPTFDDVYDWRSNLRGYVQARKLLRGERTDHYAPSDAEIESWGIPEA